MIELVKAWVRHRYSQGWEIILDNEALPLAEGLEYILSEVKRTGNEFITDVKWERNYNRKDFWPEKGIK